MSDAIRFAVTFRAWEEIATGWMAFKMEDGTTDHTVYPSKADAIAHQMNEFVCCYVHLRGCAMGMSAKDAQLWLEIHREAYDNNLHLTEPNAPQIIMPLARGMGQWPQ
jgi:hypothetical protein